MFAQLKKKLVFTAIAATFSTCAFAADLPPLNSDTEKDRIDWTQLEAKYGPIPEVKEGIRIGGVSKTLTNEYWRTLGEGYKSFADKYKVFVSYLAAANEEDQIGQLSIAETMITEGYDALLASPQTDANLQAAFDSAKAKGIPFINVNDAVLPVTEYYVGVVQKDNGVRVAKWFIENVPNGGKVAVIEGQPGVYAAKQRTEGFSETIATSDKFELVASVPANWSREQAYNAATNILQRYPDLVGFYVNNDGMALGVVEAVKAANKLDKCYVFGTDGISDAYNSIRQGELTGTVDSFPLLTGEVAMEVALRVVGGQDLPRVISTPQALITKDNIEKYSTKDVEALRKALAE